jgi:hypothetical protein
MAHHPQAHALPLLPLLLLLCATPQDLPPTALALQQPDALLAVQLLLLTCMMMVTTVLGCALLHITPSAVCRMTSSYVCSRLPAADCHLDQFCTMLSGRQADVAGSWQTHLRKE